MVGEQGSFGRYPRTFEEVCCFRLDLIVYCDDANIRTIHVSASGGGKDLSQEAKWR